MLLTALDPRDGLLLIGLGLLLLGWLFYQEFGLETTFLVSWGRSILQMLGLALALALALSFQSPWVNGLTIALVAGLWSIKLHRSFDRRLPPLLLLGLLLRGLLVPWAYGLLVVVRPSSGLAGPEALILAWGGLGLVAPLGEQAGLSLLQTFQRDRGDLETRLSLGATPRQALAPHRRQVLRQTLLPQLQSLGQLGLLVLPPLFGGLVLAGVDPVTALIYQLLLLLLGLLGGVLGATAIVDALINRWDGVA